MIYIYVSFAALFIAIYSAIISSIFAILLRDHCFPRTAPPHMLIKVQQRGETLYTQLSVDIRHLCQWRFDRWDRIGADRNWRDDCSMSIGYCCVISNYYYYISMPYTSHVVYVHCRENIVGDGDIRWKVKQSVICYTCLNCIIYYSKTYIIYNVYSINPRERHSLCIAGRTQPTHRSTKDI